MASLSTWGARHAQAFLGSLGRLTRNPLGTVLTVLVIALALSLPLGLDLLVRNARTATGDFANAVDVTVYLKPDVSREKAQQLVQSARARDGVAAVTLITADAGLADFRRFSGFGAALESLEGNPLPHVLNVRPQADVSSPLDLERLKRYFAAWPEVDLVQIDSDWVKRFNAILEVLRRVLGIAALVLGAGVFAVIGNTIRLEILNRRQEIEVTKLVGGSNGFVRRPFLYTGVLYGLAGALLAWLIVGSAVAVLSEPVAELAQLYGSRFMLAGLTASEVSMLFSSGALLGWIGAWVSAERHLTRIEPRA